MATTHEAERRTPRQAAPERETAPASAAKPVEVEVKFRAGSVSRKQLLESPLVAPGSPLKKEKLRSIYFDTPAGALAKAGITLRIRKSGRSGAILCAKFPGDAAGLFTRRESEVKIPDLQPRLERLDQHTAELLSRVIGDSPLQAKFEMQIERWKRTIAYGHSELELVFDTGQIASGDSRLPVAEIEVELKSGEEADLHDFAMTLARQQHLSLDFISKGQKGYRLAGGEPALPVKSAAIDLPADSTLDAVISVILSSTLSQFVANWAALRESDAPESVHQMRVALRRMRSALWMFNRAAACAEFAALRADAQRIASALGMARQCDVFGDHCRTGPFAGNNHPAGHDVLLAAVEERRAAAYAQARSVIDSRDTTLFVLATQSLLARRAWRAGLAPAELGVLSTPAKDFAAVVLADLRVRVRKRGRHLRDISDEQRHRLRIALKKLRYAAEFFSSLFDRRGKVKTLLERVAAVQDLLGAHNDMVTGSRCLDELRGIHGPAIDMAAGFIEGWNARGLPIADAKLMQAWKKFRAAGAFWE